MFLRNRARISVFLLLFSITLIAVAVNAASNASISFTGTDQPAFDVSASNLVNDDGCDMVTMAMTDATGQITDIDTLCLDLVTGLGQNYTDWGSFETGYVATMGPVTYSVFDTGFDDACYNDENSQACADLLASGAVACIGESYFQPASLPAGSPFPVCGGGAGAVACPVALPSGSTVRSVPAGALAYFEPRLDAYTGFNLPPGTWYVSEISGDFARVWISCQANMIWIPVANLG